MSCQPTPGEQGRALRAEEVVAALYDPRVQRAVHLALRDGLMRDHFRRMRRRGVPIPDAVEAMRGPYRMPGRGRYYLSDERVRSVVYGKQDPRRIDPEGGVGAEPHEPTDEEDDAPQED